MSVAAWVPIISAAIELAVDRAQRAGLPAEEIKAKILAAVNEKLSDVLPLAIVGVALGAAATAVKVDADINSLGSSPECPRCSNVATQHISKTVAGPADVSLSCDKCGWMSA